jgi:hypothetical protein
MLRVVDDHTDLNEPLQFDDYDRSKISIIRLDNSDIKMHGFFLTSEKNKAESKDECSIMIALETIDNQIDLNILTLEAPVGSPDFDYQLR